MAIMGTSAFPRGDDTAWYVLSTADVLGRLRSAEIGLSSDDLVLILLVATVLSTVLGHALEAIVIAVIVLFAVLLRRIITRLTGLRRPGILASPPERRRITLRDCRRSEPAFYRKCPRAAHHARHVTAERPLESQRCIHPR